MNELSFALKDFIEDNIDLIEAKAWDTVYDNANYSLDSDSQGQLTMSLLSCGIDPILEADLDYIPNYYLSGAHIKTFEIPKCVNLLSEGCFSYSTITHISIPENVEEIGPYVFYDCPLLETVKIPPSVAYIHATAFMGSKCKIVCEKVLLHINML